MQRKKTPKRYTFDPVVLDYVDQLRALLGYTYDTELLAALVRAEWERRHGKQLFPPAVIAGTAAPADCKPATTDQLNAPGPVPAVVAPAVPVRYTHRRR